MAKQTKQTKPAAALATELTEVLVGAGMTPEQQAVCLALPAVIGGGTLPEQQKAADPNRIRKSLVLKPCAMVHYLAQEAFETNPIVTRKEIIELCARHGIATHTATTQYQRWNKARKTGIMPAALQIPAVS